MAHRLGTIIYYDLVMVLDKGKVVEMAPPAVLLADPRSSFRAMCAKTGDLPALVAEANNHHQQRQQQHDMKKFANLRKVWRGKPDSQGVRVFVDDASDDTVCMLMLAIMQGESCGFFVRDGDSLPECVQRWAPVTYGQGEGQRSGVRVRGEG